MRFPEYLRERLSQREWSLRDYAERINHKSPGLIGLVLDGDRPLPLDELDVWCDAFEPQSDAEHDRFWQLAIESYAPAPLRGLWNQARELKRQVDAQARQIAALEVRVKARGPGPS